VVAENQLTEEQRRMISELKAMGFEDQEKILRVFSKHPEIRSTNEIVE